MLRNSQEIKQLDSSWSLFWIEIEAPVNDFLAFVINFASVRNAIFFDLSEDISHILAIVECFSIQAFIEGHSKSPDLCFLTILIVQESLWSHIRRRSNIVFKTWFTISFDLAVAKIYDLCLTIVKQYVGWL